MLRLIKVQACFRGSSWHLRFDLYFTSSFSIIRLDCLFLSVAAAFLVLRLACRLYPVVTLDPLLYQTLPGTASFEMHLHVLHHGHLPC